jgi:nitrogen fixation/metabolism regulation signal transduction histidine kinase
MKIFKNKTLEGYILKTIIIFSVLFLIVTGLLLEQLQWSLWNTALTLVLQAFVLMIFAFRFRKRVSAVFERALLHIEAVKMEDYNQYAKSDFDDGNSNELHLALKALSQHLQKQKSRYDQHAFLLYQLIDQLNTPMMVFNKKQKLTYANSAFSILYNQPWQMYRSASPKLLGLIETKDGWTIPRRDQQWQISQSEFIDSGEEHFLLVFTNIDSALRASQLNAWQQIIRVMGHEIRNSLTPVSSLAESLSNKMLSPREQSALALISDRCLHLQDFINRYSSLSQQLDLHYQNIELSSFVERLKVLNPGLDIIAQINEGSLWGDKTFLEQVFINLLKNSKEAGATRVRLNIGRVKNKCKIELEDNGHGFANPDNLFVPLFTTKPQGQGIGLTFCRNIIEQHKGMIDLENNADFPHKNSQSGVTISITLPLAS